MDLSDSRTLAFLLEVLADTRETEPVRIDALCRLRDVPLAETDHQRVGEAIAQLMWDESEHVQLRLAAVRALQKFTDVDRVAEGLRRMLIDETAPIELRYHAFTSMYPGKPDPENVELLRTLAGDKTLGFCAQRLLSAYRLLSEGRHS